MWARRFMLGVFDRAKNDLSKECLKFDFKHSLWRGNETLLLCFIQKKIINIVFESLKGRGILNL